MDHVLWLFDEAWERRRRRRRSLAWVALVLCGAGVVIYALTRPGSVPTRPAGLREPAGTIVEAPSAVFSKPPYMGVRCQVPNSIACDEVGLAIWLRHPAYSVRASIDGRDLAMKRFGDTLISTDKPRTAFDGYLRPAGIVSRMHVQPEPGTTSWYGNSTPFASVWVLIDYLSGPPVITHLRVPLMAGWG
jgi:hypothetical protein